MRHVVMEKCPRLLWSNTLFLVLLATLMSSIPVPTYANTYADNKGGTGTMIGVFFLGTIDGSSYEPKYSTVRDSRTAEYSAFLADPVSNSVSMRKFNGMGMSVDMSWTLGGNVFMGAGLGWQYRDDLLNSNSNQANIATDPRIYNEVTFGAIDVGLRSSTSGAFGWSASIGFGGASNNISGQYPASAARQYPDITGTALGYTLAGGRTTLYYTDTQFIFYFSQFRASIEYKPAKSNGAKIVAGYRFMYSQSVDIPKENVTDFSLDFPTGQATCVAPTGSTACTGIAPRSLVASDAVSPLYAASKYYVQGLVFRTSTIEVGVRCPIGSL